MLSRDWLNASVPVGVLADAGRWKPLGAGVLLHKPPFVWLITAQHVVQQAGEGRLAALVVDREGEVVVVDLTDAHRSHGVDWISDEEHGVAVGLMPVSPDWDIKAVTEDLCAHLDPGWPSQQCFTLGRSYGAYGVDVGWLVPLVFGGVIAGVNEPARRLYVTAAALPQNSGAPILMPLGPTNNASDRTTSLAGIVLGATLLPGGPQDDPNASVYPLGVGVSIDVALALVASDAAKQQVGRLPRSERTRPAPRRSQ